MIIPTGLVTVVFLGVYAAAQSFIMILAMAMILVSGYPDIGGWPALMANLEAQDPTLVDWFPEDPAFAVYGVWRAQHEIRR